MRKLHLIWQIPYKIYIAVIFLTFALLFQPILIYCLKREDLHPIAHRVFVLWSNIFCFLSGWRLRIKGKKNIDPNTAYVIIGNHSSFLDIFLLPKIFSNNKHVFLGKAEILSYPIIKHYFKNYHIPVFRGNRIKAAKSIIIAGEKIQKGWSIVIFPEGGIDDTQKPHLAPFKNGAFQLAKTIEAPVLPITFKNNYIHLDEPITLTSSAYPGNIQITIHPPIPIEEIKQSTLLELKNKCHAQIHLELMGITTEKL